MTKSKQGEENEHKGKEHLAYGPCEICNPAPNNPDKEDWKDCYPLDTFYGETKKELVEFIRSLLIQERKEVVEEIENSFNKYKKDNRITYFITKKGWNKLKNKLIK